MLNTTLFLFSPYLMWPHLLFLSREVLTLASCNLRIFEKHPLSLFSHTSFSLGLSFSLTSLFVWKQGYPAMVHCYHFAFVFRVFAQLFFLLFKYKLFCFHVRYPHLRYLTVYTKVVAENNERAAVVSITMPFFKLKKYIYIYLFPDPIFQLQRMTVQCNFRGD